MEGRSLLQQGYDHVATSYSWSNSLKFTPKLSRIVSEWTSMQNIISSFLEQEKIKFESLHRRVGFPRREKIVSSFNSSSSGPCHRGQKAPDVQLTAKGPQPQEG
jgi:hypothetical protein